MPLNTSFAHEPATSTGDVSTDAAERAWVDRIRAGDLDAFEALYRTYWQRLYTFAFPYVGSKEDAEEVAQEVFFGAVRNSLYLAVRNAGLSYAQIAARLGISEKTVETQLARGLKSLRGRIRQVP